MTMNVFVKTNSKENKIEKINEEEYIVYLKTRPEKGKANAALVRLLTEYFNRRVKIVQGLKSPKKKVIFED